METLFHWAAFASCAALVATQLACNAVWRPWSRPDKLGSLVVLTAGFSSLAIALLELKAAAELPEAVCSVLSVGLRFFAVPRSFLLAFLLALHLRQRGQEGQDEASEKPYLLVSLLTGLGGLLLGIALRVLGVSETHDCVVVDVGDFFWLGLLGVAALAGLLWRVVGSRVSLEEKVRLRLAAATWLVFGSLYFVLLGVLRGTGQSVEANSGGLHVLWVLMMTFQVVVFGPPRMRYTKALMLWRMRKVAGEVAVCGSDMETGETHSSQASSDWTHNISTSCLGVARRGTASTTGSEEIGYYRFTPHRESFDVANPGYGKSLDSVLSSEEMARTLEEEEKADPSERTEKHTEQHGKKSDRLSHAPDGNPPMVTLQRRPQSVPGQPMAGDKDDEASKPKGATPSGGAAESAPVGRPLRALSSQLSKLFNPVEGDREAQPKRVEPVEPISINDDASDAPSSVGTQDMYQSWTFGTRARRSLSTLHMTPSARRLVLDAANTEAAVETRNSDISPKLLRKSPRTSVGMETGRGPCIRITFDGNRRVATGNFFTMQQPQSTVVISVEDIFDSTALLSVLLDVAEKRRCTELVRFCQAARLYKTSTFTDAKSQYDSCTAIIRTFLDEGTEEEVNLSIRTKNKIRESVASLDGFMATSYRKRCCIFDDAFNEMKDLLFQNLADELRTSADFIAIVASMDQRRARAGSDPVVPPKPAGEQSAKRDSEPAESRPRSSMSWVPFLNLSGEPAAAEPEAPAESDPALPPAAHDPHVEEAEMGRTVLERIDESFRSSVDSPGDDSLSRQESEKLEEAENMV